MPGLYAVIASTGMPPSILQWEATHWCQSLSGKTDHAAKLPARPWHQAHRDIVRRPAVAAGSGLLPRQDRTCRSESVLVTQRIPGRCTWPWAGNPASGQLWPRLATFRASV